MKRIIKLENGKLPEDVDLPEQIVNLLGDVNYVFGHVRVKEIELSLIDPEKAEYIDMYSFNEYGERKHHVEKDNSLSCEIKISFILFD